MIWIASFPRSGNTFFRNILYEVYGLESATFHQDPGYYLDKNYQAYPYVKTHILPEQLEPSDSSIPAIYIIRDGRDALCSIAHHRKDIIAPGSDYYENLKAAIIAEKGTFFGGWSQNVLKWIKRADIVIRYEDLLLDPVGCAERLRSLTDMPEPMREKTPSFEQLKFGIPKYGSGKDRNISEQEMRELAEKNFRKGKSGSWKEEMPPELHELFWSMHGDTMLHLGYSLAGEIVTPNPDIDHEVIRKLGLETVHDGQKKYRVLIESNKLVSNDNDGIKRYQVELLNGLLNVVSNPTSHWDIDLFIHGQIRKLEDCRNLLEDDFNKKDMDKGRQAHGKPVKKSAFQILDEFMVGLVPEKFVQYLNQRDIRFFHKSYNFLKKTIFNLGKLLLWLVRITFRYIYLLKSQVAFLINGRKSEKVFRTYDLIHLPLAQHYTGFRLTQRPLVVTMHDFTHRYYPQYHTAINISNAEKGLRFISRKNADVIAVSRSTYQDTLKETSLDENKVHLVYEAIDKDKFHFQVNRDETGEIKAKYGIPGNTPYFISLFTIEPRKNLSNTVNAFDKLLEENPEFDINFVIVGKKGWDADRLFLHNAVISKRIIFTGFVDDHDLSALFSEAIALCYISYYEGFGLPLLEAMNCSTPVIYGNNSSMPEVVGEGGLGADPDDIDGIKDKMKMIFSDDQLRSEISRLALQQAMNFSWRNTIIDTLDVYEKIINKAP
jgi:glycosyltransferase involved in cell wall biosynthesis